MSTPRKDKIQIEIEINGKKVDTAKQNYKELQDTARALRLELQGLTPGTEAFVKKSAQLREVNSRLAEINKQTKGVATGLHQVEGTAKGLPGLFSKINTALNVAGIIGLINLAVRAAQKLFDIGKESLNLYNVQAKADAQLRATLKSTGETAGRTFEQLKQQASDLQKVTLFGDETTEQAQALLLTFTEIREEVFDETVPLIQDVATAMATAKSEAVDLKGATIQIGKALNDPVKGVSALAEVGVSFTYQQREMIKALVEGGNKAEAQRVILAELRKEFGGSAEAAAKAGTGGLAQLSNKIGDLKEVFGELINKGLRVLAPIFNTIVDVVTDFVLGLTSGTEATGQFSGAINFVVKAIKIWVDRMLTVRGVLFGIINVLLDFPKLVQAAFEQTTLSAVQLAKELELAFTFGDKAEQKLKAEINDLKSLKGQVKGVGETLKASFQSGFNTGKDFLFGLGGSGEPEAEGTSQGKTQSNKPLGRGDGEDVKKQIEAQFDLRKKELQAAFDRENLLIEGALLRQELLEQEAAQRRLDNQEQYFQSQLDLLKKYGKEQENEYLKIENQLIQVRQEQQQAEYIRQEQATIETVANLAMVAVESESKKNEALLKVQQYGQAQSEAAQKDFLKRKEENEQRTAEIERNIEEAKIQVKEDFFNLAIGILGKDEQARKKNAGVIKAFEVSRIIVNTATEISNYFKNFSAIPFVGQALAITQAAFATARAGLAISQIKAQQFAGGGLVKTLSGELINRAPNIPELLNGDNILATVRRGEVVLNERQQAALGGAPTFRRIGVPGFAGGGITEVDTTPRGAFVTDFLSAPGASRTPTSQGNERMQALMAEVVSELRKPKKNYVVYEDIVEKDNETAFTSAKSGF